MHIVVLIITLIILFLGVFYSVRMQFGNQPTGESLEKVKISTNYRNNIFLNTVETNMEMPFSDVFKEMVKKGEERVPEKEIVTFPIGLGAYEGQGTSSVLVTWLGHSTILLKMNNKVILVDPVFSKRASFSRFLGPQQFNYSTDYFVESLPKIDIVLISHDHYDHLDYSVIKKLKDKVDHFYMPLGVGSHLSYWGVEKEKIHELDWWESLNIAGIEITSTPGRHFTGRSFGRFKTLWCGWALKTDDSKIFFSGDSGYFDGFKEIGEKLGPFDLAFIECGQYSKYWSSIHMMPEESVQAAIDTKSKVAIPIHWGKFKLSIHAWNEPPIRFIEKAIQMNQKVTVPQIGQTFSTDSIPEITNWFKQF